MKCSQQQVTGKRAFHQGRVGTSHSPGAWRPAGRGAVAGAALGLSSLVTAEKGWPSGISQDWPCSPTKHLPSSPWWASSLLGQNGQGASAVSKGSWIAGRSKDLGYVDQRPVSASGDLSSGFWSSIEALDILFFFFLSSSCINSVHFDF